MTREQFYRNLDRWGREIPDVHLREVFIAAGRVVWDRLERESLTIEPILIDDDPVELESILSGGGK